jgi:integrase
VKLLILTGQRRTEIADLRWSEINIKRGTITLPPARTKNGLEHVIPMSEPVRGLIKTILRTDGRDFVFGFGNGGFAGWSRRKERLDATINANRKKPIEPWTLHDLRRTAATMMANDLNILPHVIEAALNHSSGHKAGVAGTYNLAKYEKEVSDALTLWGKRVLKIVGEAAGTNRRKSGRAP